MNLLAPRYEVIGDYPDSPFDIGDIIELKRFFVRDSLGETYGYDRNGYWRPKSDFDEFPNLFRPMHWAEKREEKDLPMYVKNNKEVYRVATWYYVEMSDGWIAMFNKKATDIPAIPAKYLLPATEEEYNNQNKQR